MILFIYLNFHELAGRRAYEYNQEIGSSSPIFFLGILYFCIPTIITMYYKKNWSPLLIIHFGLMCWIEVCFIILPAALQRVDYYYFLFLIFLLFDEFVCFNFLFFYYCFFVVAIIFWVVESWFMGAYGTLQLPF